MNGLRIENTEWKPKERNVVSWLLFTSAQEEIRHCAKTNNIFCRIVRVQ